MRAQGIGDLTISSEDAHGFGQFLRNHGVRVSDSDLVNATAQVNLVPRKDGSLVPTVLITKKRAEDRRV